MASLRSAAQPGLRRMRWAAAFARAATEQVSVQPVLLAAPASAEGRQQTAQPGAPTVAARRSARDYHPAGAIAHPVSSHPAFRHNARPRMPRRRSPRAHPARPNSERRLADHGVSPLDCAGPRADGEGNRCLRRRQSHQSATAARAASLRNCSGGSSSRARNPRRASSTPAAFCLAPRCIVAQISPSC